jgi:hypothetical protein
MIALRAEPASPAALAPTSALLQTAFPGSPHLDPARLAWDHLANPLGRSLLAQAFAGDRLVATLAGRAMRATFRGVDVSGILIHHAATHADFRRRGLLARAIEALVEGARAGGAAFAVAVVNDRSVRTFVGAGGFARLGPLAARLALGALGLRAAGAAGPPPDFEPRRDPAWLAWRLAAPGSCYAARCGGAGAEVWTDSGTAGIPVLLGDAPLAATEALPRFHSRMPLRLWVGRDAARRLAAPLAVDLPLRLRPSPLHLVFRPLGSAAPPAPDRVRFDALDFDAW